MVAESASLLAASLLRGFAEWGCQTQLVSSVKSLTLQHSRLACWYITPSALEGFAQCIFSFVLSLNTAMFGLLRQAGSHREFLLCPPH